MQLLGHIQYNINWEVHVTNDSLRDTGQLGARAVSMMRKRLKWHGHVCERDREEATRIVVEMTMQAERKRG